MNRIDYLIPGIQSKIVLMEGDLLQQSGLRIIHCANQFETHPDIISSGSMVGKWYKCCQVKSIDVDQQIDNFCQQRRSIARTDVSLKPYRMLKFPIGTLCPIEREEDSFCLAAFCEPYNDHHIENLSVEQYVCYWQQLWENLSHLPISRQVVNVALPGGRCVMVGNFSFTTAQKIGVIVQTFCKQMQKTGFCREMRIVLMGEDALSIDFQGWQQHLLPYICEMSMLPFVLVSNAAEAPTSRNVQSRQIEEIPVEDTFDMFKADISDIVTQFEQMEGKEHSQYAAGGNRAENFLVHVNVPEMRSIIEAIEHQSELHLYFGVARGKAYDKWRLLQLLGFLHNETVLFGKMNRKSLMCIGLGNPYASEDDALPNRWAHLAPNFKALHKYVGQQSRILAEEKPKIYSQLLDLLQKEIKR